MQRIMIKGRVFQQPTSEPLGDDWGQELRMLTRVRQTSATAIKQVVTNADDTTAATRADLNYVGRTVADLPEGEEKQALCQAVKDLSVQMRGPTVPGNRNGTTLRNNGSHHRVQKKRRTEAAVGAAV